MLRQQHVLVELREDGCFWPLTVVAVLESSPASEGVELNTVARSLAPKGSPSLLQLVVKCVLIDASAHEASRFLQKVLSKTLLLGLFP